MRDGNEGMIIENGDLSVDTLKNVFNTSHKDHIDQKEKRTQIAKRLKEIRKQFGLTQKELCDKIGVVLTTYASYEQGKQFIPISTIAKICELLDISADYVICISNNPKGRYYSESTQTNGENNEDVAKRLEALEQAVKDLKNK